MRVTPPALAHTDLVYPHTMQTDSQFSTEASSFTPEAEPTTSEESPPAEGEPASMAYQTALALSRYGRSIRECEIAAANRSQPLPAIIKGLKGIIGPGSADKQSRGLGGLSAAKAAIEQAWKTGTISVLPADLHLRGKSVLPSPNRHSATAKERLLVKVVPQVRVLEVAAAKHKADIIAIMDELDKLFAGATGRGAKEQCQLARKMIQRAWDSWSKMRLAAEDNPLRGRMPHEQKRRKTLKAWRRDFTSRTKPAGIAKRKGSATK